jgi:hypothetical protein
MFFDAALAASWSDCPGGICPADDFSSAESMARAMAWTRMNWQKIFSYAEVICFVSAWAVSLLLAFSAQRSADSHTASRSFAVTTDVLGIQATRTR